jgi:hypothetical protein
VLYINIENIPKKVFEALSDRLPFIYIKIQVKLRMKFCTLKKLFRTEPFFGTIF